MNASNGGIHDVGVFFPWHRLAVWNYESTLRSECNYTGTQPFWNYELDSPDNCGHFNSSPVLKDFGGFEVPPNHATQCPFFTHDQEHICGNCVKGPFANYQVYLGPGNNFSSTARCLTRWVHPTFAESGTRKSYVARWMAMDTYRQFQAVPNYKEGNATVPGSHTLGHVGIGGEVSRCFLVSLSVLPFRHSFRCAGRRRNR